MRGTVVLVAMIGVMGVAACAPADPAREPCSMCRVVASAGGVPNATCISDGADADAFPVLPDGGGDPCFARGCFPSCGGSDGGYDTTSSTTCLPGAPLPTPICVTRMTGS